MEFRAPYRNMCEQLEHLRLLAIRGEGVYMSTFFGSKSSKPHGCILFVFFRLVHPTPRLCEQREQLPLLVCSRSSRKGRSAPSTYVNPVPEGKGGTTSPQLGWYKVYGTGRPNKPETAWGPDRRGISQETP